MELKKVTFHYISSETNFEIKIQGLVTEIYIMLEKMEHFQYNLARKYWSQMKKKIIYRRI